MDYKAIPSNIVKCLHKRGMSKMDMENSTPELLFEEYYNWIGFQGYGKQFIHDIDKLRAAAKGRVSTHE